MKLPDKQSEHCELQQKDQLLDGFFRVDKLTLRHTQYRSGDWSPSLQRYLLDRPDAVCAVVHHVERNTLFFVRQFRVGVFQKDHGWMTELAAGLIDAGETPEQAVKRELLEELGYDVQQPRLIQKIYPSPGIISERIFLFYVQVSEADRASAGGGNSHEHEDLRLFEVPVAAIEAFRDAHEISDAKTLLGIQWFQATVHAASE